MWKVIVADDEPFIREALKEMIPWDELGYHLAEALKNGKEVVNAVEKYKPDIVILDNTNATYDRDGGCAVDT